MVGMANFFALAVGLVAVFSCLATPVAVFPVFLMFSVVSSACLALLVGTYELRRVETQPRVPQPGIERALSRLKTYSPPVVTPSLLSSNVDSHVEKAVHSILDCNVLPSYQTIATEHEPFFRSIVPEVWHVLGLVLGRVSKLNTARIISQDLVLVVRKHFEQFRGIQVREASCSSTTAPDLNQFPYLRDSSEESSFLRQALDVLLCFCLPAELKQCNLFRLAVREYIITRLLQPLIEKVCDPDYINQNLHAFLVKKREEIKSSSTHHASYEDFMMEIKKCEDVAELEQQRQFIITDIMHAKAVLRMKEVSNKGLRVANFPVSIPADKAKALMERGDLKLYITQLTTAKNSCERRIRNLGGGGSLDQQHSVRLEEAVASFPRAIPFETIMHNETALMYFLHYLEDLGYDHSLSFWTEVEMLHTLTGLELQKQMEIIYKTYLAFDAKRKIYADDALVGEIESCLTVKMGGALEALCQVQNAVYNELYSQFYDSFVCSESFRLFMDNEVQGSAAFFQQPDSGSLSGFHSSEEDTYKKKLKFLRKKLLDKNVVLAEFPSVASTSSSSLEVHRRRLQKDCFEIQEEIKQLEHYVEHTDEWFETVGLWSVEVFNVDLGEDDCNEKDPLFVLVVHRPDPYYRDSSTSLFNESESETSTLSSPRVDDGMCSLSSDYSDDEIVPKSSGFVVGRYLSEFQALHTMVHEVLPDLAFPPLPRKSVLFSRKEAKSKYWSTYKNAVERYIKTLLSHAKLQESEIVFNFLSRASADVSHMSLTKEDSAAHKSLLGLQETKAEDSILDHVSSLIIEIFELHDRSSVLRRQLYELFQLTFSGNIERDLQDFVTWVLSEPMLDFYLENLVESCMPSQNLASEQFVCSDEQKEQTKAEVKAMLLKSAPKTLETVLGTRNCQIGCLKIFTALQDHNANKQLLYSVLETLLFLLVSDLEDYWKESDE